jgi:hypothetical protein
MAKRTQKLDQAIDAAFDAAGGGSGEPPHEDGGPGKPIAPCPVQALGFDGDMYFYLGPSGRVTALHVDHHSHKRLVALFEGQTWWCNAYAPPQGKTSLWRVDIIVEYLILECHRAGSFDYAEQVRGPGAWRLADGRLLLHLGDCLQIFGGRKVEKLSAGRQLDRLIYAAGPPQPRPAEKPHDNIAAVDELLDALNTWNWARPDGDPYLALGWIACSMICGALEFRPHIWLTGDSNTGKSTLELLIRDLLGCSVIRSAEPSRTFIGLKLNGAARPVLMDESENKGNSDRVPALVDLARLASTEDQAGVGRGSPSGSTIEYAIRATFLFASINPAPLNRADMGRVAMLDLLPLTNPNDRTAVDLIRRASSHGPVLRARIVEGFTRFRENIHAVRQALRPADRGRMGDLLGALLGAAYTCLSDSPLNALEAQRLVDLFDTETMIGSTESLDHMECALHLLSTTMTVEASTGGRYAKAIGEAIRDFIDGVDMTDGIGPHDKDLGRHGLRVRWLNELDDPQRPVTPHLIVATKHRQLQKLFEQTKWNGGWTRSIKRFPGAISFRAVWFAGVTAHSVAVPIASLPMAQTSVGLRPDGSNPYPDGTP